MAFLFMILMSDSAGGVDRYWSLLGCKGLLQSEALIHEVNMLPMKNPMKYFGIIMDKYPIQEVKWYS